MEGRMLANVLCIAAAEIRDVSSWMTHGCADAALQNSPAKFLSA
jgi:hypothetical protein